MKTIILFFILTLSLCAQGNNPVRNIFMQGNNINTVFGTDGIFNYDRVTFSTANAGLIWPASSPTRKTLCYTTGLWIGAKVGQQRELRLAASAYSSHFTPGNIPVIGQPSPLSVCNDTTWKGYLVQLIDQSLINGGIRTKTAGGRTYTFVYEAWANWPVAKGAPYVEINGIPGYQSGWNSDRPGIGNGSKARPDELLFMVYMDYTNCINNIHQSQVGLPGGTLPLGVEIHELAFMFNCPALIDAYFVKWKIINKSAGDWDSVYLTLFNDFDIGFGTCGSSDDLAGCDTLRNLTFLLNGYNHDCNYGNNPPAIGVRFNQSPLNYTGSDFDTVKLPYDTLIGYKQIGLTGFCSIRNSNPDTCLNEYFAADKAYNLMKGFDLCGNPFINQINGQPTKFMYNGDACNRTGWIDLVPTDNRSYTNSGPFKINISDTQIVTVSYIIGYGGNNFQNVCAMKNYSDSALKYYYNDFQTCIPIGIQPISNEVPEKFALYQNYPNPFNPTTKIKFEISLLRGVDGAEGDRRGVLLRVYDILGREISTLVNEGLQPGIYEVDWNAENYPSGVYFYTLKSDFYTKTNKMVLIK